MTIENNQVNIEAERQSFSQLDWDIAKMAHGGWQESQIPDGDKRTAKFKLVVMDVVWIASHGGINRVDIANTSFDELPWDYQRDNLRSVQIAVNKLKVEIRSGDTLDRLKYIEEAAEQVQGEFRHDRKTRGIELPIEQDMSYRELSNELQELDRKFPRLVLEFYDNDPQRFYPLLLSIP